MTNQEKLEELKDLKRKLSNDKLDLSKIKDVDGLILPNKIDDKIDYIEEKLDLSKIKDVDGLILPNKIDDKIDYIEEKDYIDYIKEKDHTK